MKAIQNFHSFENRFCLTAIGIIKNKFTHLVLRIRQIEHILINVGTLLRNRNILERILNVRTM